MIDRFRFPHTPEIDEKMRKISATMASMFAISSEEADGRINRMWGGNDMTTELSALAILHETAEFWAKTVYYGPMTMWWIEGEKLEGLPYP